MTIGDTVIIDNGSWKGWRATVIDDCFRKTNERCTVLIKLLSNPAVELELNVEDVKSYG